MLGLAPGDAKILRNAGARVTEDVLRTFFLARYLLGVERIMVVAHTRCRMAGHTEQEMHEAIRAAGGPDTEGLSFLVAPDQLEALRADVERARSRPYLSGVAIGGFRYDVDTGHVSRIC
jgi:carbonic anhydrase